MADDVIVLPIDNEANAVIALKEFLAGKYDSRSVELDFKNADWLKFHLELRGTHFHQSLNSAEMRGLIEFQNAIYRSAALIIHGSSKINSLTEEEKSKLELNFRITEGSSDVDADVKEGFFALASKMVSKMPGKLIFASVLVVAIGYFGDEALKAYLDNTVDLKKVEAETAKTASEDKRTEELIDLSSSILNRDHDTERALIEAYRASDKIAKIIDERNKAFLNL